MSGEDPLQQALNRGMLLSLQPPCAGNVQCTHLLLADIRLRLFLLLLLLLPLLVLLPSHFLLDAGDRRLINGVVSCPSTSAVVSAVVLQGKAGPV